MSEESYRVYLLTFPNGMIYIGQTKHTIRYRMQLGYKHNDKMANAVKLYGYDNICHKILADGLTKEEADRVEQEMIAAYNAQDPTVGYNISKGGKATYLGLKHTEEYKRSMSEKLKGRQFTEEHKNNIRKSLTGNPKLCGANNPLYGKPKSAETIRKQYESHKHKMKSVIQYTLDWQELQRYDSIHQAEKATGVDRTIITKCAKGITKKPTQYNWRYNEVNPT